MTSNWANWVEEASEPTLKLHARGARVAPLEETASRLRSAARLVPITRVSDLTPLDPLGIPVFVAVTPLALDLTTHAGKGACALSARVSAMMEAVERVSAERPPLESVATGSFTELTASGLTPIDPASFDLPSDSSFDAARSYRWVRSRELQRGEDVWLAEDLACTPPRAGILREVDTNGLASGNTRLEATVHALCEVIERDVVSQLEFATSFADTGEQRLRVRGVALDTLPSAARALVDRSATHGLGVCVQAIESDVRVPVFRALLIDPQYPSPSGPEAASFVGFGAHPDAALAVHRALSEAFQSRVGFIHGGRDSFNTFGGSWRRQSLRARSDAVGLAPSVACSALPTAQYADLRDDLRFLLSQLEAAGFGRVIATDLTRPDLGIPVMRVRVPGLASFAVNRRRVGFRCLRHLV